MRAAVIGGGSWGTALASVLASNGHDTIVWAYDPEVAKALTERHENPKYLPGLRPSPARSWWWPSAPRT
jgi:glycerol-3-phosphate dehydrogenase (NAD(P)+)